MILLIDNYDSFSYNLYQLIGSIDPDIKVVRNDALSVDDVLNLKPERIVLSPGPGRPENAGICEDLIDKTKGHIPILGVCLGHQAICHCFGADITYAKELIHGKKKPIKRLGESRILNGLPQTFYAARYHSLIADAASLPDDLKVTACSPEGEIMAVEHVSFPIYGVQFHPESVMTEDGRQMMLNFLK